MNIKEAFVNTCKVFNENDVKYVVVGGFAVNIHGYIRATEDIDFFIDKSDENIEKIKKALQEVFNDKSADEISSDDVEKYAVIRYGTPFNYYIDFIGNLGEMFTFKDVSKNIEKYIIENVEIPVCGLETLIKMKQTVRQKDKLDLEFLKYKEHVIKKESSEKLKPEEDAFTKDLNERLNKKKGPGLGR